MRKRLRYLRPSSPQSLASRPVFSPGTKPPELVDRGKEQNEALIIHKEMFSDLLLLLDVCKSIGPEGIHARVLRELVEMFA